MRSPWLLALVAVSLQARAVEPRPLRVVTYNTLASTRGVKGIASTLAGLEPDVVALEEVDVGTRRSGKVDQATALGAALKMSHAFAPHFPYDGGEFGVALLSRFPIVRAQTRHLKGSRLAQLDATVRTPDGDVRLVVVHFTVTFPFRDAKEQAACDLARLTEARAAMAEAAREVTPVIVLGDMNDDTGSPPYKVFEGKLQDACEVKGGGLAKTWNSAFAITRIDYIWPSRDFEVVSCDTRASAASDHLPVLAVLQRRAAAPSPRP